MASVLVYTEEKKASVLVYTGEKASVLVRTGRENARVVKRDNIVYVAHGPTGPEGPAGGGGSFSLPFAPADLLETLNVGGIPSTSKVFKVQIDILAPFNNNVMFSVGIDGDQSLLFALDAYDCEVVDNYHASMSKEVNATIKLYSYYTVPPTTGDGILTIFYL